MWMRRFFSRHNADVELPHVENVSLAEEWIWNLNKTGKRKKNREGGWQHSLWENDPDKDPYQVSNISEHTNSANDRIKRSGS